MTEPLRLDIRPPRHGWATVTLSAPGVDLEFIASYVPWDSIGQLGHAASALLDGAPEWTVSWNTEPVEYEFRFTNAEGRTRLEVHEYPDHRRRWRRVEEPAAMIEGETWSVCKALWKGLRRLQGTQPGEVYQAEWRHPFPDEVMRRLSERFRTR